MTNSNNSMSRNNETVQGILNVLHDSHGKPWSAIGQELGIPEGTLWDIANGKPVPRKWRRRLGLRVSRDLYAMPVKELRWAIENREEM